jgi:ubiquitin-protein ligase
MDHKLVHRLQSELARYEEDERLKSSLEISGELTNLRASFMGPDYSPYSDGVFFLLVWVTVGYLLYRLALKLETQIAHRTIRKDGSFS